MLEPDDYALDAPCRSPARHFEVAMLKYLEEVVSDNH